MNVFTFRINLQYLGIVILANFDLMIVDCCGSSKFFFEGDDWNVVKVIQFLDTALYL
jgi:hypothetical protein